MLVLAADLQSCICVEKSMHETNCGLSVASCCIMLKMSLILTDIAGPRGTEREKLPVHARRPG